MWSQVVSFFISSIHPMTSTFHCKHELPSINHCTFSPSIISSKNICQQYTMSVGHLDTFFHSSPSSYSDNKFMEWHGNHSWSFSCFISYIFNRKKKEACLSKIDCLNLFWYISCSIRFRLVMVVGRENACDLSNNWILNVF